MSDFRIPTHNKRYSVRSANRFAFMVFLMVGVLFFIMYMLRGVADPAITTSTHAEARYIPDAVNGKIYQKPGFSLSYVEEYELPEWVAYTLTIDMMNSPKHERDQEFQPDPHIATGSAHYHDYKGSGYRRGHLVPSADMAWDKASMDATFHLSNVAPMVQAFNDGIWLELEHNVRDWSRRYKQVQVVTGPVFNLPVSTIGDNEVLVPRYFYKAVFAVHNQKPLVIGFLLDQTRDEYETLDQYIVPIDSIESVTGIDLFSNLYGSWDREIELEKTESALSDVWPLNPVWYEQRID